MTSRIQYSIDVIREEARRLVCRGVLERRQPIYTLCQHIPVREWEWVERELEEHGFLLRDQILDLLGREDWCDD
ncbi:MAG TPA: DUF4327 family protein [Crinalium sp.]|jgi:hypothetical protein